MSIDIGSLFSQFSITQWIVVGIVAFMFLTGKLKLQDLISIFQPTPNPNPTPTPNPNPTPTPIPTPSPNTPIADLITSILHILLPILLKARASKDKDLEDATVALIQKTITTPPSA